MGNKRTKWNIPMCAALILLLLTMVSFHLTSGLYARYSTTATASDSGRVAKFAVSGVPGGFVTMSSTTTDSGACTMRVTNNSEVTVKYSLRVVLKEQIPNSDLEITLDGKNPSQMADDSRLFLDVGTLAPNTASGQHTITFTVKDWTFITKNNTDAYPDSESKPLPFTVIIIAEQID